MDASDTSIICNYEQYGLKSIQLYIFQQLKHVLLYALSNIAEWLCERGTFLPNLPILLYIWRRNPLKTQTFLPNLCFFLHIWRKSRICMIAATVYTDKFFYDKSVSKPHFYRDKSVNWGLSDAKKIS